ARVRAKREASVRIEDWFLTDDERGNPASPLAAWSSGNAVVPRVHGAEYFARLVEEVSALKEGDHLWFTDWRGDAAELLTPDGPTWPSRAASTCATPAATTPSTTATRRRCRWRRSTASTRRGTTSSSSCTARSSGCSTTCSGSAGPTRGRSTPTTRSPTSRT